MLALLRRQAGTAVRLLLLATIVLGLAYPAVVWGLSRAPGLRHQAEGSVVVDASGASGSTLIGVDPVPTDAFADPWFHARPSASARTVLGPGDPSTSGGSNQGGFDPTLLATVEQRRTLIAVREGVSADRVPPDAVTASASGVDPDISPAYAELQVPRVARVNRLPEVEVRALVAQATTPRALGILGEPGVDVTTLNLALLSQAGHAEPSRTGG